MGALIILVASLASEQNFKTLLLTERSCGVESSALAYMVSSSSGRSLRLNVSGIKKTIGSVEAMNAEPIHMGIKRLPSIKDQAAGTPTTVAIKLTAVI